MFNLTTIAKGVLVMLLSFAALSCSRPAGASDALPLPKEDIPAPKESQERSTVFAGGCFWCTEAVFQQLDGVKSVVSGYSGGARETATYKLVCGGDTGHAEVIRITYDPTKISYGTLLRVFFSTHNPMTLNQQDPDHGTQYRSAIFYANDPEKQVAQAYIKQLTEAGSFDKPIVTTLEELKAFYPAEEYHQDFADKNPDHPYIQRYALSKVKKTCEMFRDLTKPPNTGESK
jgi:peptide-methionine (S)-S-oxide reductase